MKKVLFLFGFLFALSLGAVNAQSCASAGKSCCSGKVAKAASADQSIEKRVDDKGVVSYVRKETDQQGNVKFVSVRFDEPSSTFVNEAPKSMSADTKAGMVKKEGKACAAGETGKACCKSGDSAGKSCSKEAGAANQ